MDSGPCFFGSSDHQQGADKFLPQSRMKLALLSGNQTMGVQSDYVKIAIESGYVEAIEIANCPMKNCDLP